MNKFMEKAIAQLASRSQVVVITIGTIMIVLSSVPLVYFLLILFEVEYTKTMLIMSVIAPALMVPPTLLAMMKISRHLVFFKEALEQEIEKNKQNDILLFEQARFVQMGEMIANISHQWKQPLNTISLAVLSLKTSTTTEEERNNHFDIMEDNVNYLATTVDDFMSFFDKKTHLEMRDITSIVSEIKSIIGTHIANKNIELNIIIDDSYGQIKVASSISQIILNLLNNSKDAFEKDSKKSFIMLQFITNEYGLEIECCDNGKGIDKKIKEKIFDPYFSTKSKNKGTGIGLYMSKEIIQKVFNGQINVSSRKYSRSNLHPIDNSGKTCFFIAIPYSQNCIPLEDYE